MFILSANPIDRLSAAPPRVRYGSSLPGLAAVRSVGFAERVNRACP